MLRDVLTIAWKDWREFLAGTSSSITGRSPLLVVGLLALVCGFLAYRLGVTWFHSPFPIFYTVIYPVFITLGYVADSFAGERERHTLETLVATRLSPLSIQLGKLLAITSYTWSLALVVSIVGLVMANLKDSSQGFVFYAPDQTIGLIVLPYLTSVLAATIGSVVSLYSNSVRQAQQTLSISTAALFFLIVYGAQVIFPKSFLQSLAQTSPTQLGIEAGVLLVVLDVVALAIALSRGRQLITTA